MNSSEGVAFIFGFIFGMFAGIIIAIAIDTSYEAKACEKLESQVSVKLAYSYNEGCHIIK